MANYIFVFYPDDDADIAVGRVMLAFDHDDEALGAAGDIAHLCQVDVWGPGDQLIAQITKRKTPKGEDSG